jgi:predicted secreted protein
MAMRLRLAALVLLAAVPLAAAPLARAGELTLAETAAREVTNDRFVARLAGRAVAGDPATAQDDLNALMARATAAAADTPALTVDTGGYVVRIEQPEEAPERWVAEQELRLESADRAAVTAAVGTLQDLGLATRALGARVSEARAAGVRDALIREAVAALRARAEVAASAFDLEVAGWRAVHLDGARPAPRMMQADAAASSAPVLTAGRTTVRVTVEATAELAEPDER